MKKELLEMSADIQLKIGEMMSMIYDADKYSQDDIDNFATEKMFLLSSVSDFLKESTRHLKNNVDANETD